MTNICLTYYRLNLINSFEAWDLDKGKLTMLLRDNASNAVKACNDWGISHFGCVSHCLHLIVGPFLLCSKKEEAEVRELVALAASTAEKNRAQQVANANTIDEELDDEDEEDADIGGFEDPFSDNDEINVKLCRVVVNKI